MEPCRFCARPRRHGSVMCGTEECRRAYYREWHRAKRRTHPERYGTAFYRARKPAPKEPSPRVAVPSSARLEELREWVAGLWYGATKPAILERFPEFYGECRAHTSEERRFYRDIQHLLADGAIVHASGRYIRAERAHAVEGEAA